MLSTVPPGRLSYDRDSSSSSLLPFVLPADEVAAEVYQESAPRVHPKHKGSASKGQPGPSSATIDGKAGEDQTPSKAGAGVVPLVQGSDDSGVGDWFLGEGGRLLILAVGCRDLTTQVRVIGFWGWFLGEGDRLLILAVGCEGAATQEQRPWLCHGFGMMEGRMML